jgi:tetratricopeptide (TPR) repeat protein
MNQNILYNPKTIVFAKRKQLMSLICLVAVSSAGFAAGVFAETKTSKPELLDILCEDLDIKPVVDRDTASHEIPEQLTVEKQTDAKTVPLSKKMHLTKNDLLLAKNPTTTPERQLWKARISASNPINNQTKNELAQLIHQINAVKFEPQAKDTKAAHNNTTEPQPVQEENGSDTQDAPKEKSAKTPEQSVLVSEQTIQRIRKRLAQPEKVNDPLGLGDLLFESHCFKDAAACYHLALDRLPGEGDDSFDNKSWILFQLGNCLQKNHPDKALEYYDSVITDHPGSTWEQLAKAKSQWIRWCLQDQPSKLIESTESE